MSVWKQLLTADNQTAAVRLGWIVDYITCKICKIWQARGEVGGRRKGGGGRLCRVDGRADLAGIVHELLQLFLAIIPLGDQAGPTRGLGAASSRACTCSQAMLLCKR